MRFAAKTRFGFTLIELAVVVMILGVLAAIAVPKLLGASQEASDNTAKQSLGVIRTAIDNFSVEHQGKLPGADGQATTFAADLAAYLRGPEFPKCPVGEAVNGEVRMLAGSGPVGSTIGGTSATHSWVYQFETGEFHINSTMLAGDGVTEYDEF